MPAALSRHVFMMAPEELMVREPVGRSITSDRLTMWTATLAEMRAELTWRIARRRVGAAYWLATTPEWPPERDGGGDGGGAGVWGRRELRRRIKLVRAELEVLQWRPWYVAVRGLDGLVVGRAWVMWPLGDDGVVGIGCDVVKSHRGREIEAEVVGMLVGFLEREGWGSAGAMASSAGPA